MYDLSNKGYNYACVLESTIIVLCLDHIMLSLAYHENNVFSYCLIVECCYTLGKTVQQCIIYNIWDGLCVAVCLCHVNVHTRTIVDPCLSVSECVREHVTDKYTIVK